MPEPMVCMNCGWMFDEAKEGKAFAALEQGWVCPTCGCPTDLFEPLENSVWKTRPYGGSLHPENEGLQDAVRESIAKDTAAEKKSNEKK
jgi:rubredoxin